MKFEEFKAQSISQFPSTDEINELLPDKYIVTIPVKLLSFYRDPNWTTKRPGILMVTDFTENRQLLKPKNTPTEFIEMGSKVPMEQLLTISVPMKLFKNVENVLRSKINNREASYNFQEFNNCSINAENLWASVTCSLKIYGGGGFEGIEASLENEITLLEIQDEMANTNTEFRKRSISQDMKQSKKINIQASDLIFDPYRSDLYGTQLESQANLETQFNKDQSLAQEKVFDSAHQDLQLNKITSLEQNVSNSDLNSTVEKEPAVIKKRASQLDLDKVASSQTYEIKANLKAIHPLQFIIKPHGRTAKFSPVKFYFESCGHNIEVELLQYQDFKLFFNLIEFEDALDVIKEIYNKLSTLVGKELIFQVQKSSISLPGGAERKYWSFISALDDLL